MSKERAAALEALKGSLHETYDPGKNKAEENAALKAEREKGNAGKGALIALVGDGLNSLARIAQALEDGNKALTIAPMGEGRIVGELAKFEPAIDPVLVERLVAAVEKLASAAPAG